IAGAKDAETAQLEVQPVARVVVVGLREGEQVLAVLAERRLPLPLVDRMEIRIGRLPARRLCPTGRGGGVYDRRRGIAMARAHDVRRNERTACEGGHGQAGCGTELAAPPCEPARQMALDRPGAAAHPLDNPCDVEVLDEAQREGRPLLRRKRGERFEEPGIDAAGADDRGWAVSGPGHGKLSAKSPESV